MAERDAFERQFAEAVRAYAAGAPTEVDAGALVRSLAATTPRVGRLVRVAGWRLPGLAYLWVLLALALLLASMLGLSLAGGLPDLRLLGIAPAPTRRASLPAVVPPTSPVASALPTRTTPEATPAPPYGAGLTWSGFAPLPRFGAGHTLTNPTVGDVTAGGHGFVAVGSDWVAADQAVAVAWLSADGRTWTEHRIGIPGTTSLLATPALSSVATGGGRLVAVGRVGIWRSTDGADWEQALGPDELDGVPLRVAWAVGRFVAIGRSVGDPCAARVWLSTDGTAWLPVALPDAAGVCPTALAGGAGGFLAAGLDPITGRTALMCSSDGLAWTLAPAQAAFEGNGHPEGVARAGNRWIAFGSFLPGGASERGVAVWTSTDGLAWRRTALLRPAGADACDPGSAHMLGMAPYGPGYVAVGRCTVSPEQVGIAWASTDGTAWQPVLGRVRPMLAVASDGTRLVALGADWPGYAPITSSAVLAP